MRIGTERGRKARPDLKIGICGEHGGDPDSVSFCHEAGLDYVSCSAFRVPVARLAAAQAVEKQMGAKLDYQIGTMIELPRAALQAHEIAQGDDGAQFFSFGTNDLTQTCLGLSRDDAGPILSNYVEQGIFEVDPFVSIDREGVGELMRIGIERGRKTRGKLKIGICGEHGGDPASVAFCHSLGLDYVSCSPFRVPIARLAAAQAALGKDAASQA